MHYEGEIKVEFTLVYRRRDKCKRSKGKVSGGLMDVARNCQGWGGGGGVAHHISGQFVWCCLSQLCQHASHRNVF